MKTPRIDTSGAEKAAAANLAAQQAAQTMQQNFATDLRADNVAKVEAGGTATVLSEAADMMRKKKPQGLSSTLGIQA